MNIDNPAALHFIMQDDIFLLKSEAGLFEKLAAAEAVAVPVAAPDGKVAETVAASAAKTDAPEPVGVRETNTPAPISPSLQHAAKQAPAIKYRGNNKNGYVILVHYPATEWMHDAHLTALESTLKRKGIEPADTALVNTANGNFTYDEFITQLKPQKILLMGKESLPAGIPAIQFNQLQQLANCTALYTFSFGEMMDSNENKKIFWEQMKML